MIDQVSRIKKPNKIGPTCWITLGGTKGKPRACEGKNGGKSDCD